MYELKPLTFLDFFNIKNYATNGFKVHFDYGCLYNLANLAPSMLMAATTVKPRIVVHTYCGIYNIFGLACTTIIQFDFYSSFLVCYGVGRKNVFA